jgi:hypothetical protein
VFHESGLVHVRWRHKTEKSTGPITWQPLSWLSQKSVGKCPKTNDGAIED